MRMRRTMLTDIKLGVGDIVLIEGCNDTEKFLIVSENESDKFEVSELSSGQFKKVLRNTCKRYDLHREE